MPVSSIAAALAIGVSLGLLGGGGSILTVPALIYLVKLPPIEATAASLVVVGLTALSGALQHARAGHLDSRAALLFLVTGVPGSYLGAIAARQIGAPALLFLFAGIMVVAGLAMIFRREAMVEGEASLVHLFSAGFGVGLITGLVGVGGGFLIVPALVLFARVPMGDAVGTSLAVIAVNCASGFAGRLSTAGKVPWALTLWFSAVAIGGSFVGAALARRIPVRWLRRAFGVFVIGIGAFMIASNL